MQMFEEYDHAKRFIDEHRIQMVDFQYCDLWGRPHHLTVPVSQFTPTLLERGLGIDGSSVGLKSVKAGDMVVVPDLSTAALDPFWAVPTLNFLCNTLTADAREPYLDDPRTVAQRAERYLRSTGIAEESRWGPEFEFYVFNGVTYENEIHQSGYRFQSDEAEWNSAKDGGGPLIPLHGGYHASPPKDKFHNLRSEITLQLEAMGIPVKYHHHEVGGAGQLEIEIPMIELVAAGDAVMRCKYVIKMVAKSHEKVATFMPKPLYGEAGNGMHFHQNLLKENVNLFYDREGYGCLSKIAHHYIGGLLHHSASTLAFTNPSTNSYRRLVPGFEAPVNAFFSLANRSAAIRIPKYTGQPDTARIEFRPPDATSNPYLALAAQLMAGIDGIDRKLEPTELGFGPIDADVYSWNEEQRQEIRALPTSLIEAFQALESDHDYLLEGGVFTESLIEEWIRYKLEVEYWPVQNRPHPYEISLYLDV
jgi:glutamine synthetase